MIDRTYAHDYGEICLAVLTDEGDMNHVWRCVFESESERAGNSVRGADVASEAANVVSGVFNDCGKNAMCNDANNPACGANATTYAFIFAPTKTAVIGEEDQTWLQRNWPVIALSVLLGSWFLMGVFWMIFRCVRYRRKYLVAKEKREKKLDELK